MKIYNRLVLLKEVAKKRDKLEKLFSSKRNIPDDNLREWVIDELREAFDFDGEEE